MTIQKVCRVEVRVAGPGEVTLLFTPLRGLEPERDADGSRLCFGIPLSRDGAGLAGLVHDLARWLTGLVVQEVQVQQAEIQRVTSQGKSVEPTCRASRGE